MKAEEIIGIMVLGGIFIICMIAGYMKLSEENNYNTTIGEGQTSEVIHNAYNSINSTIVTTETNFKATKEAFADEGKSQNLLKQTLLAFQSIFQLGFNTITIVISIPNALNIMASQALGIPPIVTGGLSILLLAGILFALWRVYKGSE